jgi:hypothetical protein
MEFTKGGTNKRENLRLVCGAHNRYRSDQLQKLRREFMERAEHIRIQCLEQFFTDAIPSKAAVVSANST